MAVACGVQHTLLLRSDGTVASTGLNLDGQTSIPELDQLPGHQLRVLVGPRPVLSLACGGFHSLLLDASGRCYATGCDAHGQCQVGQGPYTQAAAGHGHSLLLSPEGLVKAYGDSAHGQCDVPVPWHFNDVLRPEDPRLVPQQAMKLRYVACAAGGRHSLLLRNDGRAVAFGFNQHGQCDIPLDRYLAVACGENHSVLLLEDGTAVAYGDDQHGQCRLPVLPLGQKYVALCAGAYHTLLLRSFPASS